MRCPVVVWLALAGGALAGPPGPAPTTWADWVGDWDGKLHWAGCSTDGAPAAIVPLEASDGVVAIDLSHVGIGLGTISLLEDGASWSGQTADASTHVMRVRDGVLDLAVDLASGCQLRATLRRATSGLAGCDRLMAWARIEERCSKLSRPPLENAARLARQRATWISARGDARTALGGQCEARASKVAAELIDVGCAPNPDPAIGLRGAQCHGLNVTVTRVSRCPSLPDDVRRNLVQQAAQLVAAAIGADDASLPVVETQCRQLRDQIVSTAHQGGCPP